MISKKPYRSWEVGGTYLTMPSFSSAVLGISYNTRVLLNLSGAHSIGSTFLLGKASLLEWIGKG